jgi:hypothetical protein
MTRVVLAACLLALCSAAIAKDPTPLPLQKGARVGILDLLDSEVTHLHTAKVLTQGFLKTIPVRWQVDSMLSEAVAPRLTELGLVAVAVAPTEAIRRGRDEFFVNNSVAKGLPKALAKELQALATDAHLDALIVLAPGLNNSSQAGPLVRKELPDYLRGWGFVTSDDGSKPAMFNMTQLLLIGVGPDGAQLRARDWGGGYSEESLDYVPGADPRQVSIDDLDKLQPLFGRILDRQAAHLLGQLVAAGS